MTQYLRLSEIEEVLDFLWADGPNTFLLAGGTDLLSRPARLAERKMLLDLSALATLRGIARDDTGELRLGALETHADLAQHSLVRRRAPGLALACGAVGSPAIRHRATLGGNLANASPAADSAPALMCYEAVVCLRSRGKQRWVPVRDFFLGPGQTALGPDELIESLHLPARPGRQLAFYRKLGTRLGMGCAKASLAFLARHLPDGRLSDVRIALGAVAPTPIRVPRAEAVLEGRRLDRRRILEAAQLCSEASSPIDDLRSSEGYRRRVVAALLNEGLLELLTRQKSLGHRKARR